MPQILIIEDDPNSADILTRILHRASYEVLHATEGLEGLRLAGEHDIDLILLDLNLPDVGGHTVAALINRLPGKVPIIAVTGSTDSVTQRRAMTYGCSGYITKPINTRTFVDDIEKYLDGEDKS